MTSVEQLFPMQDGPPIPWSLARVIYAGYSALHGTEQSLERIAERGGFGWGEVEVLWNDHRKDGYRGRYAMKAALSAPNAAPPLPAGGASPASPKEDQDET